MNRTKFMKSKSFRILVLTTIACSLPIKLAQGNPQLEETIQALGFHPLNAALTPISLPNLQGKPISLEKFHGRWIFLVFWATWCSACQKKMPILETLHVGFQDENLQIVAISIDEEPKSQVIKYAKEKDLTYPILHDNQGQVAKKYQATSIPTIYLVSPNQRIAGIAKGVINWSTEKMMGRIEKLLTFNQLVGSHKDVGLTLPNNLVPPAMELILPKEGLLAGMPNNLSLAIRFPQDSSQFLIKVPKIHVPENINLGNISSSTSSSNGENRIFYHFSLEALKPGTYVLGPMELGYQHRRGGQEQFTRLGEVEYSFAEKPRHYRSIVAYFILVTVLAGAAIWRFKKGRRKNKDKSSRSDLAVYQHLRKLRLQGHHSEYAISLVMLFEEITGEKKTEVLQQLKFGNLQLNEPELRVYEKQVERYYESLNPKMEDQP